MRLQTFSTFCHMEPPKIQYVSSSERLRKRVIRGLIGSDDSIRDADDRVLARNEKVYRQSRNAQRRVRVHYSHLSCFDTVHDDDVTNAAATAERSESQINMTLPQLCFKK